MVSSKKHKKPHRIKTKSAFVKIPVGKICGPKKLCKAFQDISIYFSEEEWGKLTKWQKSVYVYMKRNYNRMTGLGVTVNQPVFMRHKARDMVKCIEIQNREESRISP